MVEVEVGSKSNFRSVSKELVLKIVAFSSFITLSLSGIQIFNDYQTDISKLNKNLDQVTSIIIPELTYSLWHMDTGSIQQILNSITGSLEYQYAEIEINNEETMSSGVKLIEQGREYESYPLNYRTKVDFRNLGQLRIYPNYTYIFTSILDRALVTIASNAIKTFIVTFFMFSLFRKTLLTPLFELSKQAKEFDTGKLDHDFAVSRAKTSAIYKDEVDIVVDSLNIMRANIEKDILEIEKYNNEKQDLAKKLSQSQKMEALGRLAGGVAHDFNNILHIILSSTDMIDDLSENNKEVENYTRNILDYGEKGKRLIQQILSYTHQREVEYKDVDIKACIEDSLAMARVSIAKNFFIDFKTSIDGKIFIRGDYTQVQQILLNLLTNARDAMSGAEGSAGLSLDYGPNDYIKLIVSDNGDGIPEAIRDKVFEPYFTTKDVDKGTGMGLSIIQTNINSMGGYIYVDSAEGEGTSFTIGLPLSTDA